MKIIKMMIAFFFLCTATISYSGKWSCCLCLFFKEKQKRTEIGQSLNIGGEVEMNILSSIRRIPLTIEQSLTPKTPPMIRNNSDLDFEFVPAENNDVRRDETPWHKAEFLYSKEQKSQTPPLPQVQTQEALDLDTGWDNIPSNQGDSMDSLADAAVNSTERFRHLSSDESVHSPKRKNSQTQTIKRVTFTQGQ
jgi:hypothetical protein